MPDIKFPLDLSPDHSPIMMFVGREWKAAGKKQRNVKVVDTGNVITLKLPFPTSGLSEINTHKWAEEQGMLVAGVWEGVKKVGLSKAKELLGPIGTYAQYHAGETVNDYASLLFSGSEFRSFDFSFDLIPKSAAEAETLTELIKQIKIGSSPSYDGSTIGFPYFWKIRAILPGKGDLILYKSAVITNFTCNYFHDNIMNIYQDGNPMKITIDLAFREIEKVYRQDIE
jgi:hypothetical protein